jgi:hypothetical protein
MIIMYVIDVKFESLLNFIEKVCWFKLYVNGE